MPRRQCWGPAHVVRLLSTNYPRLSPLFFFFSFVRYEPWVRHAGGLLTTGLLGAFRPEIHTAYEDHCSRPTFHPDLQSRDLHLILYTDVLSQRRNIRGYHQKRASGGYRRTSLPNNNIKDNRDRHNLKSRDALQQVVHSRYLHTR